jgi:hypothetical protein
MGCAIRSTLNISGQDSQTQAQAYVIEVMTPMNAFQFVATVVKS